MSRRSAAWIVVAIGVVLFAGIAIGRHPVATPTPTPTPDGVAARPRPISSKLGPKHDHEHEHENESAVSSGARISAEKTPRLPVEARFPIPTDSSHLPTIEIANEKTEERRQRFWQSLREFADGADLTQAEWERFLGDLSDVSSSELEAYKPALDPNTSNKDVQAGLKDAVQLNNELAHDLDERLASWMTERQWKIYDRMDSGGLLAMTRQLRLLGYLSPASPDARR